MQKSFLIKLWLLFQFLQEQKAEEKDEYGPIIVGGLEASKIENFPYQAAVLRYKYVNASLHLYAHTGGASIISKKYLLSAAHIFYRSDTILPASSFIIGHGSIRIDTIIEKNVSNIYIHEKYNPPIHYDIAVLKIVGEFVWDGKTQPVPLARTIAPKTRCVCSGWGHQKEHGHISYTLMYINLTIISDYHCHKYYGSVKPEKFCAYAKGMDACHGDSGGPFVCNGLLTGIISSGGDCGKFPGLYTKVPYFLDWIEKIDPDILGRSLQSESWKPEPCAFIFIFAYLIIYMNCIV